MVLNVYQQTLTTYVPSDRNIIFILNIVSTTESISGIKQKITLRYIAL